MKILMKDESERIFIEYFRLRCKKKGMLVARERGDF